MTNPTIPSLEKLESGTRLTAKDFDPKLLQLYDFYAHGMMSKREFLNNAGKFAVGSVSALALLNVMSPNYALAEQVSFNDPDITATNVEYTSPNGNGRVEGYLVKPSGAEGPLPAVLVIHENRGLNPYIKDVARRAAKAGFMALAPDGLTSMGGYPGNDEDGKVLQKQVDSTKLLNDFFAGYEHLATRDDSTGKVGCVGFCYGGGVCNALAAAYPELNASVPYYGRQLPAEQVPAIKAPLLLHYGSLDERINKGWAAYEAALKENGKQYTAHFYENANHGFHNDSTPRYDEANAKLSWDRTIEFFKQNLA